MKRLRVFVLQLLTLALLSLGSAEFAAAQGIRQVKGKYLTLVTDLPSNVQIDSLPMVFEKAIPEWCRYFEVDRAATDKWHMTGYLMKSKERFKANGMLPADLPPFLNGFQRGRELWFYEQPTAYYRRHLLLHEGTHAFMSEFFGDYGPPWYMEGMAEILGTHKLENGQLKLGYFPKAKTETPEWGRIRIVQDEVKNGRALSLVQIMKYPVNAHLKNEAYGWCWAATAFFENHPKYRDRFRKLRSQVKLADSAFNSSFYGDVKADWGNITRQWQLFVMNIDYGYDVAREAFDIRPVVPLPANGAAVQVQADRGWQSTGFQLEPIKNYQITANGRYQIVQQPKPWMCEPNGVTVRYHKGKPLGMLLGAVVFDSARPTGMTPLMRPFDIGSENNVRPKRRGTLYLRVNDSPAELADNSGALTVRIK